MSEVISYTAEIESDCEVTKMSTFTSKGGGLTIQIQLPLEGKTAALIADYLNAVANKYKIRLKTTHEADAYLIFQCVRASAKKLLPQLGAQNIRHRLEELKIKFEEL